MRSPGAPTRRCPSPPPTTSTGIPSRARGPTGYQTAVFGLGCFWGAEKLFWQTPGVYSTAVGYAGGYTPNPSYEEVCSGRTGHTEVVLVVFDPAVVTYEQLLKEFWEDHDPTQGMRQGNDRRHPVPQRPVHHRRRAAARRRGHQGHVPGGAVGRSFRRDHDRDRPARRLLLRRAVPPAVPGQEPARLLPHPRHRREVRVT